MQNQDYFGSQGLTPFEHTLGVLWTLLGSMSGVLAYLLRHSILRYPPTERISLGCLWLASLVLLVSNMVAHFLVHAEYRQSDLQIVYNVSATSFYMLLPLVVNYMSVWASTRLVRVMAIASTAVMFSLYAFFKVYSLLCKHEEIAKFARSAEDAQLLEICYLVSDVMRLFIMVKCIEFTVRKFQFSGRNILVLEGSHLPTPQPSTLGKDETKMSDISDLALA